MAEPRSFDVLVIGSGASGLAAAVSADRAGARVAVAAKGSLQSCNSAKAQGGIQAAFGEDDSPEQHAEDVWKSSHETADRKLVEILTSEAPSAIHWLEELGVEFTRENGGYRLARCGGASARRLLQVGDRTGHAITTALRDAAGVVGVTVYPKSPLAALEPGEHGWRARAGEHALDASTIVLAAGGRCYAEAELSLPYVLRRYRAAGIDPLAEKILTYPVLHYQNGGLVIGADAETTLEGVFACGEIAGGTHGRNRMMGNSLLECVVFGRRAGMAAAERSST